MLLLNPLAVTHAQRSTERITRAEQRTLSPKALWMRIASVLQRHQDLQQLEIVGQGTFHRNDLNVFIEREIPVAASLLQRRVARLHDKTYCLPLKEELTPFLRHIIAGDDVESARDLDTLDVTRPEREGEGYPLEHAACHGQLALVKKLLKRGADPDLGKNPPLFQAVMSNELQVLRTLLDAGADVNKKGVNDITALMLAVAACADPAIVQLLVERGADVKAVDSDGDTIFSRFKIKHSPYKEIFESKMSADIACFTKFFRQTKALAHIFNFKGSSSYKGKIVDWGGGDSSDFARLFARATNECMQSCPSFLGSFAAQLAKSLELAAEQESRAASDICQSIRQGEPTFIFTGSSEHAIAVLFWKRYFCICDTEYGARPLVIYSHDTRLAEYEKAIQLLLDIDGKTKTELYDALFLQLPILLHYEETIPEFEKRIAVLSYPAPNCSWASLAGAVKAALFFARKTLDRDFIALICFFQMSRLEKYLTIEHDRQLINKCFTSLWTTKKQNPQAFDTYLTARLAKLESTYRAQLGIKDQLVFRIKKLWTSLS